MQYLKQYKKAFLIRKVEEMFLDLFKEGKISGTIHTCIGQEFSGVFAAENSQKGDFIVSNHRGHGHYLSFTNDIDGLVAELLGTSNGCSKGIGGSQHLIHDYFLSNGIQGGMLPVAAGIALANKLLKNKNIAIAFLGDGTLGEGIVYETLNISSLWKIPIVFILEKNNISQSTAFEQGFAGNLKSRINGFGIDFLEASIYNLDSLNSIFNEAFERTRQESFPVFIQVEVARLNSHSKGDDNRDPLVVQELKQKDPLNLFLSNNKDLGRKWNSEINKSLMDAIFKSKSHPPTNLNYQSQLPAIDEGKIAYNEVDVSIKNNYRFNELIYNELKTILANECNSIIIGEDIENSNEYNPNEYGGAFKVTRDLSNLFSDRVKNTPISEQAITGFGIGLSLNGFISIVEIMFGDFTSLVFDQLLQHASKFSLMYGRIIKIPFILRTPMGGFRGYGPTHSQSIEKHFLGIPGLRVIALNQLLNPNVVFCQILKLKEPTVLIENKILYTKKLFEGMNNSIYKLTSCELANSYPIMRLTPVDGNAEITIVSYGGIVNEILSSLDNLFLEEEITVDLFVVSDLTNINIPGLSDSLINTKKVCIIEEGSSFAAYSSELVAGLLEERDTHFKLLRIANRMIIPSSRDLELHVLPTKELIKTKLKEFCNAKILC